MSFTYFKWIQYLERRDISKFLKLYSRNSILIPRMSEDTRNSIDAQYSRDIVQYGRIGVFKNFENLLFSYPHEFKILDHSLNIFNSDTKLQNNIFGTCNFLYKGSQYNLENNISLVKEKNEWKIFYHYSTLDRVKQL